MEVYHGPPPNAPPHNLKTRSLVVKKFHEIVIIIKVIKGNFIQ